MTEHSGDWETYAILFTYACETQVHRFIKLTAISVVFSRLPPGPKTPAARRFSPTVKQVDLPTVYWIWLTVRTANLYQWACKRLLPSRIKHRRYIYIRIIVSASMLRAIVSPWTSQRRKRLQLNACTLLIIQNKLPALTKPFL